MVDNKKHPDSLVEEALDKFWEVIPPVWGTVRAHIRALATEKYDISVEQFHILRCVHRGHCTISELAEVRNISRPAISQGVDGLVSHGLLARSQNDADRRYVDIELTTEGNTLLDDIFQSTRQWMKTDLGSLNPADLENLIHSIEILRKFIPEAR